jgi:hypothetical protein
MEVFFKEIFGRPFKPAPWPPPALQREKKTNYIIKFIFYRKNEEIRFTSDKSKALLIS